MPLVIGLCLDGLRPGLKTGGGKTKAERAPRLGSQEGATEGGLRVGPGDGWVNAGSLLGEDHHSQDDREKPRVSLGEGWEDGLMWGWAGVFTPSSLTNVHQKILEEVEAMTW